MRINKNGRMLSVFSNGTVSLFATPVPETKGHNEIIENWIKRKAYDVDADDEENEKRDGWEGKKDIVFGVLHIFHRFKKIAAASRRQSYI